MKRILGQLSKVYNITFKSFEEEERGYVNTGGYLLDDSGKKYFLKKFNSDFTVNRIEIGLFASIFFKEQGFSVSVPIQTSSEEYYVRVGEAYYSIYNFVVGDLYTRRDTPLWLFEGLGELEAKMHLAGEKHPKESNKVKRPEVDRKEKFTRIFNEIAPLISDQRILDSLELKKDFVHSTIPPVLSVDEYILVHGDLTIENIFWKNRVVESIIDFDNAQIGHPYFHIIRNLRITLATDGYDETFMERMDRYFKGYQEIHKVDEETFIEQMVVSRHKIISGTWVYREVARHPETNITALINDELRNTEEWTNNYQKLLEQTLSSIRATVKE